MKKIFALLLAVMLMATCFIGCGKKETSDLAYIRDKGTLVVGITEYAPMDYLDDKGEWIGFDADFGRMVAEKLGVKNIEFTVLPNWGQKFNELATKNIDAIWNGMTITDEVKANTNCTKAYAINAQVLVMKADKVKNYPDTESIKSLKFAVENNSAGAGILDSLDIKGYTTLPNQANALMEVAAGTADACVIDITMANAMVGEGTDYAQLASGISLSTEEYGIGFRKDSDVTAEVNKIIDQLLADGSLAGLSEKYKVALPE